MTCKVQDGRRTRGGRNAQSGRNARGRLKSSVSNDFYDQGCRRTRCGECSKWSRARERLKSSVFNDVQGSRWSQDSCWSQGSKVVAMLVDVLTNECLMTCKAQGGHRTRGGRSAQRGRSARGHLNNECLMICKVQGGRRTCNGCNAQRVRNASGRLQQSWSQCSWTSEIMSV